MTSDPAAVAVTNETLRSVFAPVGGVVDMGRTLHRPTSVGKWPGSTRSAGTNIRSPAAHVGHHGTGVMSWGGRASDLPGRCDGGTEGRYSPAALLCMPA